MLFARIMQPIIKKGTLVIIDHRGDRYLVGSGDAPKATVRFTDPALGTKLVLDPALHAGEGYMNGTLIPEDGTTIFDILDLVTENLGKQRYHWIARSLRRVERMVNMVRTHNPAARSHRNVAHHYDLSPDLYKRFLDAEMIYSAAYYRTPDDTLELAQQQKLDHIARKLDLRPDQHVLDVGCGWGGTALHLARNYGVRVTGISLSKEQLAIAQARAEAEGLKDKVEFRFQDYRDLNESFDRVVSVGMFEHVGLPHYRQFFDMIRNVLPEDGVALVHTIGRTDGPGATDNWTRKYIFPGGYSPALSEVVPSIESSGLILTDVETWRMHYAHTLREWRRRFLEHREAVTAEYDGRFCRMFEFFLASAECAFLHGFHVNFQFQLCKSQHTLPPTREYMYAGA